MLRSLAARPGHVVSRDDLLREVWAYHPSVITRVVDLTISRLRRRIKPDPVNPAVLKTVHGEECAGLRARPRRARRSGAAGGGGPWLTVVGAPGIGALEGLGSVAHASRQWGEDAVRALLDQGAATGPAAVVEAVDRILTEA